MNLTVRLAFCCLALVSPILCRAQQPATGPTLDAIPKDLEVKLALSALPPYLRSEAAVYVLDPSKGYGLDLQGH